MLTPAGLLSGAEPASSTPVLVELFTSEGCSSCPPADVLLKKLSEDQPVRGAQIIVLSEHVDYWNSIGWTDPFSSPQFSRRQGAYARRLHAEDGPYTPQMVVDGTMHFVGSDRKEALKAIAAAAARPKIRLRLTSQSAGPRQVRLTIEADRPDAEPADTKDAELYIAVADLERSANVTRGENQGRFLKHTTVVRKLLNMGKVSVQGPFRREATVDLESSQDEAAQQKLVAFIQGRNQGPVLAVGSIELTTNK